MLQSAVFLSLTGPLSHRAGRAGMALGIRGPSALVLLVLLLRLCGNVASFPHHPPQAYGTGLKDLKVRSPSSSPDFDALPNEPQEINGFPDYRVDKWGKVYGRRGHVLKGRKIGNHSYVNLIAGSYQFTTPIHKIVVDTFVGPRPSPRHRIDHINHQPDDNRVNNLHWATPPQDQRQDLRLSGTCFALGTTIIGSNEHEEREFGNLTAVMDFIQETKNLTFSISTIGVWVVNNKGKCGYRWSRKEVDVGEKRLIPPEAIRGATEYYATSKGYIIYPNGSAKRGCIDDRGNRVSIIKPGTYMTHRLVAAAFYGLPQSTNATLIRHIDGDKANNSIENLMYMTPAEAMRRRKGLAVQRLDPDSLDVISEYASVADANVAVGKPRTFRGIHRCLKGKSMSSCSYRWRYKP